LIRPRDRTIWLYIGLIVVAFGLWVYGLDEDSLWRDEGLTVGRAEQPLSMIFSNRNFVQGVSSPDLHPPLYFLCQHAWIQVAGRSEFSLRFPSVLAMVLALPLFGAVGRRIWGHPTGLLAAALAILSPFFLWYAQEARMYAWIVLESLALLYTWWPLLHQRAEWGDYVKFALAAGVLTYTHYSGVFLVAYAVVAVAGVRLERVTWRRLVIILIGIALISIPLYANVRELLTAAGFVAFSQRAPWTLLREAISTFSLGSAEMPGNVGWRLAPMALLSVTGALTLGVAPRQRRLHAALIGAGGFLGTLLLFYLASWLQANYSNPRHLTLLSPLWFLLAGHGLATLRIRLWPSAALAGVAILVLNGEALYQTVTDPPIVRDDVRGVAEYLRERALPGDALLWHDAVMMTTYEYYALDLPFTAIPRYGQNDRAAVLEELQRWTSRYQRVWFVSYPPPPFFDGSIVTGWLRDRMVRLEMVNFPASWTTIWLQLYRPPHLVTTLPDTGLPADLREGPYWIRGIASEEDILAGNGTWVSVYWSLEGGSSPEPSSACVRLLDSAGTVWSQGCVPLTFPGQTPPTGTLIEQQLWLPLPLGLAPTSYVGEVSLNSAVEEVGTLSLQRPTPTPTLSSVAHFSNGVELVDLEWIAEEFRPGLWAIGDLLWRTQAPLHYRPTVTVRLVDWLGREVSQQVKPLGPPDYPPEEWQPGEIVRSRIALALPFTASGLRRVQVALSGPDNESIQIQGILPGRWVGVGRVRITEWPMERELSPDVQHRLDDVYLGDEIRLVGYDVAQDDGVLTVDLYWKSDGQLAGNYGVFVHVGMPGEQPLAQAAGGPANWTRPIESWRPDEIIRDSHSIQLPSDEDYGELSILIGMYDLDQPEIRLPVSVGGESNSDGVLNLGPLPQ
jgi:hypothetical protein